MARYINSLDLNIVIRLRPNIPANMEIGIRNIVRQDSWRTEKGTELRQFLPIGIT